MAKDKNEASKQEQELTREQQLQQQLKEEDLQRKIRERRSDVMDRADIKEAQAGSDGTKAAAAAGAAVLLTVLTGGVLLPLVAVGVAAYYGSKSINEKQQAREDRDYAMALSEGSKGGNSQEQSQAQGREPTEPEKSPEEKVEDKVRSQSEQYQAAYGAIDGSLKAVGVKGKAEDKYKLINSIVKNGGYDQIDSKEDLQERTQQLTQNIQDELNIPGVQGVKGEIGQDGLDISSKNGRYKRNAVDLIKEAGAAAGPNEDWHQRRTDKREENLAKQDVRRDVRQGVNNYVVKPAATAVDYTVVKPAKAVAGAAVGTAMAAGRAATATNNTVNPFRRGVNAKKAGREAVRDNNKMDKLRGNPKLLQEYMDEKPELVKEFMTQDRAEAARIIQGSGLSVNDVLKKTGIVSDESISNEIKGNVEALKKAEQEKARNNDGVEFDTGKMPYDDRNAYLEGQQDSNRGNEVESDNTDRFIKQADINREIKSLSDGSDSLKPQEVKERVGKKPPVSDVINKKSDSQLKLEKVQLQESGKKSAPVHNSEAKGKQEGGRQID